MRHSISVVSDFQVVRYDPEYSDLSNPQGAVVEEVFHLLATDEEGNRRIFGGYHSLNAAESAIPEAPPVAVWVETYPEYGSPAFVRYGETELVDWEARHRELEEAGFDDYLAVA